MEILIGFAQLWLLSGCVGLVILFAVSITAPDDTYPIGVINPLEILLLAIATIILPFFGPITLALAINKLIEVKDGQ